VPRYLVSTHRTLHETALCARDALATEPDVKIIDASDPNVVTIDTTPDRAEELRRKLYGTHYVELESRRSLL
jgi:hypothetical protein